MRGSLVKLSSLTILVIPLLIPIYTNAFATYPYEPSKILLFRIIVLTILITFILFNYSWGKLNYSAKVIRISDETPLQGYPKNPLILPVLSYGVVYLLATVNSINFQLSVWGNDNRRGGLTVLFLLLYFFLVTEIINSWGEIYDLISILIIGTIPVTLYSFVQLIGLDPLSWQKNPTIFIHSTFSSHIYLGGYVAMIIPFTLSRIKVENREKNFRQKTRYLIVLILQLICLALTFSRSAILGLVAGLIAFYWMADGRKQVSKLLKITLILGIMAALLYGLIYLLLPSLYINTGFMGSEFDITIVRQASNYSRIITWQKALEYLPQRWLFGFGPETFSIISKSKGFQDAGILSSLSNVSFDPHNLFLYQLISVGVTGLLCYSWVIIKFFMISYFAIDNCNDFAQKTSVSALVGSIVVYLVQSQFNPDGIVSTILFWLIIAIGSIAYRSIVYEHKVINVANSQNTYESYF